MTLEAVPLQPAARWVRFAHAVWYVAAFLTLATVILAIPGYLKAIREGFSVFPIPTNPSPVVMTINAFTALVSIATALLSLYLSFLLFRHRANGRMALFLSFYLLAFSVSVGPFEELRTIAGANITNTIWNTIFQPLIMYPASCFLFLFFPDGRFAPNWGRRLALASIVTAPVYTVSFFIWEYSPRRLIAPLVVSSVLQIAVMLSVLYAQFYRYRHIASGQQRQQIKWFIYGLGIMLFFQIVSSFPYWWSFTVPAGTSYPVWLTLSTTLWFLSLAVFLVSLAVAVLRYRLYDIDVIISRTLIYGTLTISTLAIYIFIVGYVGDLFQNRDRTVLAFIATGLVAVLFQPLRDRLQHLINHWMYGERDDPYAALTRLGRQLEDTVTPDAILPATVDAIANALKLPYVEVTLVEGQEMVTAASVGQPVSGSELIRLPLVHQNMEIGQLVFGPRAVGESFSTPEMRLLNDLARQVEVAAHNVRLTADLRKSRERIVTAREEERRHIRRELHDGLGPTLAGLTLKIDAARNLLKKDSRAADSLLLDLKSQMQTSMEDIRRLAYTLRPPALDELGLLSAIRETCAGHEQAGLSVTVETPNKLPPLSAAVEVATYRIISEALTNVSKHAQARECHVQLMFNGELQIDIQDNGIGLQPGRHSGVGMLSMRERAAELGGTFAIHSVPGGGVHITVYLPCEVSRDEI